MIPRPGRQGAGMYELRSGMATISGDEGDWPIGPAANPAKPAPSAMRLSMAETGTILAHGLPCRSTNMAKRNSTPSLLVAATRSSLVVIGSSASKLPGVRSTWDVLIDADRLLSLRLGPDLHFNNVASWETAGGFPSVAKCCPLVSNTTMAPLIWYRRTPHSGASAGREWRQGQVPGAARRLRRVPGAPLFGGVAVEELEDVHVVHAGEGAGRQNRQDVRVRARRRPGHALPSLGKHGRRALAALAVRAAGPGARLRLAATEPAGMIERHAEGDRVPRFAAARVDLRDAEIGTGRRVGVLVERRVAVLRGEHLAARPLAAHPLPLDRAGGVGREDHAVVLVGLVDDAARVVLHEVAGHAEMLGDEVGHPVRGHLVGDGEDVDQVLDGQVTA